MRTYGTMALLTLLTVPVFLQADEGEDHTALEIAAPPIPDSDLLVIAATTEQFEVVIKYPASSVTGAIPLTLFLSDAPTNEPIEGAQVEIHIPDAEVSLTMTPTGTPGIYEAMLNITEAHTYDLLTMVTAGERMDMIPLSGLYIGEQIHEAGDAGWTGGGNTISIALVAILLLLGGVLLRRARRTRRYNT